MKERVLENLNRAIAEAMQVDERIVVLGEDIADPYGGAFKVTRGLTSRFPDRVLTTPISELGFTGFANGLALAGQKPIVEYMFGDFILLAADQIVNFSAKSVDMYGSTYGHSILFRCPVGGHRGYGATHSQSLQKHFFGVPGLDLYELSPLHDMTRHLPMILNSSRPSILFEQKTLYARPCLDPGQIDDCFVIDHPDASGDIARARIDRDPEVILLCPGGQFEACHQAARQLLFDHGIECEIRVPFTLFPSPQGLLDDLGNACRLIVTVEESAPGGTWGSDVAACHAQQNGGQPVQPFLSITSVSSPIPSAHHLEREILPGVEKIVSLIAAACQ